MTHHHSSYLPNTFCGYRCLYSL